MFIINSGTERSLKGGVCQRVGVIRENNIKFNHN